MELDIVAIMLVQGWVESLCSCRFKSGLNQVAPLMSLIIVAM